MNDAFGKKLQGKLHLVFVTLVKMGVCKEDAEDITQDTAIQFLQYIDGIEMEKAQAWLFRVAINKYYDSLRKKKTSDQYVLAFNTEDLFDRETPEIRVLQKELQQNVQGILGRMKPRDAEILLLKYSADFSLKEIAKMFQTSDKTIKTQLARAKQKMVRLIEEGQINERQIHF